MAGEKRRGEEGEEKRGHSLQWQEKRGEEGEEGTLTPIAGEQVRGEEKRGEERGK